MENDLYEEIVESRRRGSRAALATIISRKGSTPRKDPAKMLIYEDGRQMGSIGGGCTEAEVCKEALAVMRSEKPRLLSFDLTDEDAEESALLCGGVMEVYVEPILPDPTLFIFGAGHVGQAAASVARMLGFKIAVVDDRIKYANSERFPQADTFYVDSWEEVFGKLPVNDSSYLLIATRGHQYDLTCLRFALRTPARYIGLLGSRRKTKLLYEALEREGVDPTGFERVFAPVGLEIGSETPEEIAVSIAAELVAVRKNLDLQPLKQSLRYLKPADSALRSR
ncbi:MAG TPA: XdhC/CoxI family protein [Acidobacteriota bacterium]|nr:XdhC/CoxI family protein [Acidobacteriota bacterium]